MPDATTRRIDRLERHIQARGPQVDVSWMTDIVAEVYGSAYGSKLTMPQEAWLDLERVLLKVYGDKQEA